MNWSKRFNGVFDYIYAHWPVYLFGVGGAIVAILIAVLVSAQRGWWAFILLALAALIVLAYYLAANLWTAHQQYDTPAVYDTLFELGQLGPDARFVHLDLGRRLPAINLARRLTTGRLVVVDIYNPQLTPSPSLKRWRQRPALIQPDPRLVWRDGNLELLPLPDASMPAVTLVYTASYFWQRGDRLRLLQEIHRILAPGGRLLMAEQVRSRANFLLLGPAALRLPPHNYWPSLLQEAGFHVREARSLRGLVCCFSAERPVPQTGRQLPLNF